MKSGVRTDWRNRFQRTAAAGAVYLLLGICAAPLVAQEPESAAIEPATPTADLPAAGAKSLKPASFQGVVPGSTSREDAIANLGKPESTQEDGGVTILQYEEIGPFQRVDVLVEREQVTSIIAHLKTPTSPSTAAQELGLEGYRPAVVADEAGQPLGVAFPERGILFSYLPLEDENAPVLVGQIVLEPLTAEPFWLRAQSAGEHEYGLILEDLAVARQLGLGEPLAWALEARIQAESGATSQALELSRRAATESPDNVDAGLLYAQLLAQVGEFAEAERRLQGLLEQADHDLRKGQIHHLLGQVQSVGIQRNLRTAVEHQTTAIGLVRPLLKDQDADVRRTARMLLIDTHLATALYIAHGPYQQKTEVVPQWLADARNLMNEQPVFARDKHLLHRIQRYSLAALAAMDEPIDPTSAGDSTLQTGEELIAAAEDSRYKAILEWHLGVALYDAARIEQKRGQFEAAVRYANTARRYLTAAAASREGDPRRDYTLGSLDFLLGSLHAVYKEDHARAVAFYNQAIEQLNADLPPTAGHELGLHGERFVSMGVSFWQIGKREEAVELTKAGVARMEQAAESKLLDKAALIVPYGNLSAMQSELGMKDESRAFAEKAARIQASTRRTIR